MAELLPREAFPYEASTSLAERAVHGGSPLVQERLPEVVVRVAAGQPVRYSETALVRRNLLITVDLAMVAMVRGGAVTALIYSAIDITGQRCRTTETGPAAAGRSRLSGRAYLPAYDGVLASAS